MDSGCGLRLWVQDLGSGFGFMCKVLGSDVLETITFEYETWLKL